MKKYNRPGMEITKFHVDEIITLSVGGDEEELGKDNVTEFSVDTQEYTVEATDSYKM